MKIAVCLSGYPRTWRHCLDSQLDFFGGQADYFLHTWRDGHDVLAPRDWTFDELNSGYRPKGIYVENRPDYADFELKVISTFDRQRSSANLIYIAHGIYEADRLRRAYEKHNGFSYDVVFRCRYDLLFHGTLNTGQIHPHMVTFPHQANYHGGYNDQVCCGSSSVMTKFSSLLLHIDKTLRYPPHKGRYIGERVLLYWLQAQGLLAHRADIEYRVLRPAHAGVPFEQIPVNDMAYSKLRNQQRLSRAHEILGFTT